MVLVVDLVLRFCDCMCIVVDLVVCVLLILW